MRQTKRTRLLRQKPSRVLLPDVDKKGQQALPIGIVPTFGQPTRGTQLVRGWFCFYRQLLEWHSHHLAFDCERKQCTACARSPTLTAARPTRCYSSAPPSINPRFASSPRLPPPTTPAPGFPTSTAGQNPPARSRKTRSRPHQHRRAPCLLPDAKATTTASRSIRKPASTATKSATGANRNRRNISWSHAATINRKPPPSPRASMPRHRPTTCHRTKAAKAKPPPTTRTSTRIGASVSDFRRVSCPPAPIRGPNDARIVGVPSTSPARFPVNAATGRGASL